MADLLKSKRLREERAPVALEIQKLADKMALDITEGRGESAEDTEKYETLNASYDGMSRSIELAERAERVSGDNEEQEEQRQESGEKKPSKPAPLPGRGDVRHDSEEDEGEERNAGPTEEQRAVALQGWMLAQLDRPLQQRHKNACTAVGIRPYAAHFDVSFRKDYRSVRTEHRALGTQIAASGGALIPDGFVNNLEMALLQFGGMRTVADVLRTDTGNNIPWPTSNDTSNEGAILGEATTVGSSVDPTFGATTFHAYKYSSKLVQVAVELLEDSAFNLAAELGRMLGERIGRITNRHFTVGTGASQPWGLVPSATVGVTTASASAIAADEILTLVHAVDPAYRPGSVFMMLDSTLLALRKLKDGNGQYLWQPGFQAGMPDMLLGYPVVANQHMAAIAASAKVIAFGALNKYKIRDVSGFRLRRLVERYADTDQEGFIAFSRHDGNLLDAGTHPVQVLQMHS